MPANQPLPEWVSVLQALLVPVIAAVGAWIALQQMHLARVRLRHDLFDRRFAILQSTHKMLLCVMAEAKISGDVFASFAAGVGAAKFVFDETLFIYLREVQERAAKLRSIQIVLPAVGDDQERAKAAQAEGIELACLIKQLDGLGDKFKPFLQLEQRWTLRRHQRLSR